MDVKEQLEDAMDFCLKKAKEAGTSEETADYISEYVKIANSAIEIEKNRAEIELATRKYEDSLTDNSKWLEIAAGLGSSLMIEAYRAFVLKRHTKMIFDYERNDMFTSSPGKGLLGSLRITPIFGKGDR